MPEIFLNHNFNKRLKQFFFETKSSSLRVLKYGKLRSNKDGKLTAIYAIKKYASTTTLVSE